MNPILFAVIFAGVCALILGVAYWVVERPGKLEAEAQRQRREILDKQAKSAIIPDAKNNEL
jgi:Na+-translocating ferredoxin:NAD+ oxidoreductase RnfG subunit